MMRDLLRDRLRAAVAQVVAHRKSEVEARRRRRALKALRQASGALEGVALLRDPLNDLLRHLAETPASPQGDRWAVAREVSSLLAEGTPTKRVLYALVEAGACKGPQSALARCRCGKWLRQERRRYRLRT